MGRKGSGVEIRENSIRLTFVFGGEACRETLRAGGKPMPPTPANIKYATRLAADIRRRLKLGTFSYAEFFPDSAKADEGAPATFGSLAQLWMDSKGQLEAATRDQYGTAVRFWKGLLGESTAVRDLTYQVLAARIGKHPWPSAKAHNNYLIALRGIFAFEYSGRRSGENPMIGIKNLKVVKKLPDPLTANERDQILVDMETRYDQRIWAYFAFAFYTGMRPEEIIALRWSDVDFQTGIARIQRVRTFKGTERDGSKTHAERDVDLVAMAMEALKAMKPYTFLKRDEQGNEADIFENPVTGRAWHDERSQRDHYWQPTLKRLGIRRRRPYSTRHAYCTVALMRGVNPAYIASQAGHSVKMLLEKYARWIPGADGGSERRLMEAAMASDYQNSSPDLPQETKSTAKLLKPKDNLGRHDWTRTNDPYHVKVVL
jgi:integrase